MEENKKKKREYTMEEIFFSEIIIEMPYEELLCDIA